MSVHLSFIDLNEADQARELRSYMKVRGANVSDDSLPDFVDDISELIENCAVVWSTTDTNETEIEAVMNSFISLIILIPNNDDIVSKFCQIISNTDGSMQWNQVRLKVLSNLFNVFNEKSSVRYIVYNSMVKLAGHSNQLQSIPSDLTQAKQFCDLWAVPKSKSQDLLRNLHDAYLGCGQKDNASKVMIELLGSYTESTAGQARDDAYKCVLAALADPNTFLLDHLLTLKPVKLLEGDKIYELLMIFIAGKLGDYQQFSLDNKDYLNTAGLDHEQNVKKMRLLTFMHLAESNRTIDFQILKKELDIKDEDIEQFIIDAIKTKNVMAKIDQLNKKVFINSATLRTFSKQNWIELNKQLESWKVNLEKISQGFQVVLSESAGRE